VLLSGSMLPEFLHYSVLRLPVPGELLLFQ
jgi:hypothetical protein